MTDDASNDGGQPTRRHRPQSLSYRQKTDAVAVVAPVNALLAVWSPRVAFLRAMVQRKGMVDARAASRDEAISLLDDIRRTREDLAERCRGLPQAIGSHGRVLDAQRSLDALESQLSDVLRHLPS